MKANQYAEKYFKKYGVVWQKDKYYYIQRKRWYTYEDLFPTH